MVLILSDKIKASTRRKDVVTIPPKKVTHDTAPRLPGINTPTTKEPNTILALSTEKVYIVLSFLSENILLFFYFATQSHRTPRKVQPFYPPSAERLHIARTFILLVLC